MTARSGAIRIKLRSWENRWPLLKRVVDEAEAFAES